MSSRMMGFATCSSSEPRSCCAMPGPLGCSPGIARSRCALRRSPMAASIAPVLYEIDVRGDIPGCWNDCACPRASVSWQSVRGCVVWPANIPRHDAVGDARMGR